MRPPLKTIRFRPRFHDVAVPDAEDGVLPAEDGNLHARLAEVADVSLTSLARELNALRETHYGDVVRLHLYDVGSSDFWPLVTPDEPVAIKFYGDRMRVEATARTSGRQLPNAYLAQILLPLMRRYRMLLMGTTYRSALGTEHVDLKFEPQNMRGRRISELVSAGRDAVALVEEILRRGGYGIDAVRDLVVAGRTDLLVGQRETADIEVKSSLYRLHDEASKYELAKDVAAFANTGQPALIVLGLKTTSRPEGDVIIGDATVSPSPSHIKAMYGALRTLLLPYVTVRITVARKRCVMIEIPAQPPDMLPVLVRRAYLTGALAEEHFTVPVRLEDRTSFWDGSRLHSLITAGRVALASAAREEGTIRRSS